MQTSGRCCGRHREGRGGWEKVWVGSKAQASHVAHVLSSVHVARNCLADHSGRTQVVGPVTEKRTVGDSREFFLLYGTTKAGIIHHTVYHRQESKAVNSNQA